MLRARNKKGKDQKWFIAAAMGIHWRGSDLKDGELSKWYESVKKTAKELNPYEIFIWEGEKKWERTWFSTSS